MHAAQDGRQQPQPQQDVRQQRQPQPQRPSSLRPLPCPGPTPCSRTCTVEGAPTSFVSCRYCTVLVFTAAAWCRCRDSLRYSGSSTTLPPPAPAAAGAARRATSQSNFCHTLPSAAARPAREAVASDARSCGSAGCRLRQRPREGGGSWAQAPGMQPPQVCARTQLSSLV